MGSSSCRGPLCPIYLYKSVCVYVGVCVAVFTIADFLLHDSLNKKSGVNDGQAGITANNQ